MKQCLETIVRSVEYGTSWWSKFILSTFGMFFTWSITESAEFGIQKMSPYCIWCRAGHIGFLDTWYRYDKDGNNEPCCKRGHKAHWAVLSGMLTSHYSQHCLIRTKNTWKKSYQLPIISNSDTQYFALFSESWVSTFEVLHNSNSLPNLPDLLCYFCQVPKTELKCVKYKVVQYSEKCKK